MKPLCLIIMLLVSLVLTGCVTTPKIAPAYRSDLTIETLVSTVSLSVHTPEGGTGGSGYLVFRRPDRFHLVVLTPFGTPAMDFFVRDDRITLMIPSKSEAYVGSFADLPDKTGFQGWRMMRWVLEEDPFFTISKPGRVERVDGEGRKTVAEYDADGLLARKVAENGDEAVYRDFQSLDGIPFPATIEFADRRGLRVKIVFDEPEINKPVDEAALTPNLAGMTLLPLASFKGM